MSQELFYISKLDIEEVVEHAGIGGLTGSEEAEIEATVLRIRDDQERTTLTRIEEELRKLEKKHIISSFDRKFVMQAFREYAQKEAR